MTGRLWTKAEDEILRHGWPDGIHCLVLATKLGRSIKSTRARAATLGLKRDPKLSDRGPLKLPELCRRYVPPSRFIIRYRV